MGATLRVPKPPRVAPALLALVVGQALLLAGVAWVWPPAALMLAGLEATAFGLLHDDEPKGGAQ